MSEKDDINQPLHDLMEAIRIAPYSMANPQFVIDTIGEGNGFLTFRVTVSDGLISREISGSVYLIADHFLGSMVRIGIARKMEEIHSVYISAEPRAVWSYLYGIMQ